MRNLLAIGFIALLCVGLSGCSKSEDPNTSERFFGTYAVKRSVDLMDPSTGNHFYAKDSFLLIVDKANSNSEIRLFSQDTSTAFLSRDKFVVNLRTVKRSYGNIGSQPYEVTGSGSFSGDSIYYTENLSWGGFGLRGKSQLVGVKQ